jgi:hypothetical protein
MGFCQNCGKPLAAGAAFCTHCGAAAPPASQASKKGTGPGKVLLIVGGVLLLAGVLAVAGLFYAGQKLKQKVENASGVPETAYRARRAADPCSLLPAAEAARVTGFQVERAESRDDVCRYFGTAGRAAEEGRAQAEEAMRRMRANEPKDGAESARAMEDLMKGLAAAGASGQSGEVLRITVKYGDEARQEESAVRMALGLMGAAADAKGSQLEGVGDRAYLLPMAVGLHMAKGDAYVMIEGPAAPGREVLIAAAKAIAGKL